MDAMAKDPRNRRAKVRAVSVEIHCPDCSKVRGPIPERDGSRQRDSIPNSVTCPWCGTTYEVGRRIEF
jgi:uncharacterized Zn-finger protein